MKQKILYFFTLDELEKFAHKIDFGKITESTSEVNLIDKAIVNGNDIKLDIKTDIFGNQFIEQKDYTKDSTNYIAKIKIKYDNSFSIKNFLGLKYEVKYNEIFLPEKQDITQCHVKFIDKKYIKQFLKELKIYDNGTDNIKEIILDKKGNSQIIRGNKKEEGYELSDWIKTHWKNMPEHNVDYRQKYVYSIIITFKNYTDKEVEKFKQGYDLSNGAIIYPAIQEIDSSYKRRIRVLGGRQPKFPIFVISKGRYDYEFNTSHWLSRMGVYHYVVVEPQEVELYSNYMNKKYCKVIAFDMTYKDKYVTHSELLGITDTGTGPGACRNFCIDYSKTLNTGTNWLLICDDNLQWDGITIYKYGRRLRCYSPEIFSVSEDFLNRYSNIGLAGYNYMNFNKENEYKNPININTRIYSFVLMRNDLCPLIYQEGRYNEDTDQSLRLLKQGYCTVQFNMFLFDKIRTQRIKQGGNSKEFYNDEGTYNKSKMLELLHPDVTKCVKKLGRWHHIVDYSVYKQDLKFKKDYKEQEYNDPMYYVVIPSDWQGTDKDCADYILAHIDKVEQVDIKKLYGGKRIKKDLKSIF